MINDEGNDATDTNNNDEGNDATDTNKATSHGESKTTTPSTNHRRRILDTAPQATDEDLDGSDEANGQDQTTNSTEGSGGEYDEGGLHDGDDDWGEADSLNFEGMEEPAHEKTIQSFSHFDPKLLKARGGTKQKLVFVTDQIYNKDFYLGAVTRGYRFGAKRIHLRSVCGREVLSSAYPDFPGNRTWRGERRRTAH